MTRRARLFPLALALAAAVPAGAKVRNPDLYTLYDVTRNAEIVVQGTVKSIDAPRQVVTLAIDRTWHGKVTPEQSGGTEGQVRYEVRGSLDPYRVGRRFVEFLDANLPYGTQDPKTIMAPLKPRSPRNRVWLDDPEGKEYADFVVQYLTLTAADRGARWSAPVQEHLVKGLEAQGARTRLAAGESLADLLTLSDRGGKVARDLLGPADKAAVNRVFMKGETPGPGSPLMKVAMTLDEPALATGMVHGSLYLPQSGIETKDSLAKALSLSPEAAARAVRDEYAGAKSDAYREMLITAMAAIGGSHGESFLWELVTREKREALRHEALQAVVGLGDAALWDRIVAVYRKEPEAARVELLGRIAACYPRDAKLADFIKGEMKSAVPELRNAAAFEAARGGDASAIPVLTAILESCRKEAEPSLECLSAMDGLRRLQTPEAIGALEKAASATEASAQFKEDAARFLDDIRRIAPPGS